MKEHKKGSKSVLRLLFKAMSLLENDQEAQDFLTDLCTPAELEAMADRLSVIPLLKKGIAYRTIHEKTGVSVATVTRIARCLASGTGGYELINQRLEQLK